MSKEFFYRRYDRVPRVSYPLSLGKDLFGLGERVSAGFDSAHASGRLGAGRNRARRESSGSSKSQGGNGKGELHLGRRWIDGLLGSLAVSSKEMRGR